jgi:hypothetical protein
MIWVAWRQHRKQALIEAGIMAVAALLLLLSGYQMIHVFKSSGLAKCLATAGADCGDLRSSFSNHYNGYQFLVPLFLLAPVLFGMFFGAPLIAREIENGTHRLAWTQGVTRKRWLSTHAVMVVGFAIAGSAALAALVTWWSRPLVTSSASGRFTPGIFDLRGVVPIAYTIFAVMLGVAVGALVKKTLPAVGLTLAGFAAVRVPITLFVRQYYMSAKTVVASFGDFKGPHLIGGQPWVIGQNTIDRLGNIVSRGGGPDFDYLAARCPGINSPSPVPGRVAKPAFDAVQSCIDRLGLHLSSAYQPGARFWTFQWIEFGIFIVLALVLAWFVVRRVRRLA